MSTAIALSQLAKLSGVKARTLQYWTLSEVIRCEPESKHAGPGVPRRYPDEEVAITLILGEISKMPLQVGALRQIAEELRRIMRLGPDNGIHDPYWYDYTDEGMAAYWGRLLKMEKAAQSHEAKWQAKQFRNKCRDLKKWAYLDIARRWTRPSHVVDKVIRDNLVEKPDDIILELSVDDVGRWNLNFKTSGVYRDGGTEESQNAPAIWSLRLLLNLTRTLKPVREDSGN